MRTKKTDDGLASNYRPVMRYKLVTMSTFVAPLAFVGAYSLIVTARSSTLTILHTFDTRGALQSCGCSSGQLGGLSRQGTLIEAERRKAEAALVIDGGNLAPDSDRALVVLRCLRAIGYDAALLIAADEQLGDAFLAEAGKVGIPVVGSMPGCERLHVKQVAHKGVALAGIHGDVDTALAMLKEFREEATDRGCRLLIISSECGQATDRQIAESAITGDLDVILFSAGLSEPTRIGRFHLVPTPQGGKAVCRVEVSWEENKVETKSTQLLVNQDLPEDGRVASVLAQYYGDVARRLVHDSSLQPADRLTQPYADRDQCVDCHQTMVKTVSGHKHSHAVQTLKEKERLVPECLTCHSELYRRTQQWRPDSPFAWNGVECATCHGDGILHSQIGTKESVTRKVPESACRGCHTTEQDPGFNYEAKLKSIQHWR